MMAFGSICAGIWCSTARTRRLRRCRSTAFGRVFLDTTTAYPLPTWGNIQEKYVEEARGVDSSVGNAVLGSRSLRLNTGLDGEACTSFTPTGPYDSTTRGGLNPAKESVGFSTFPLLWLIGSFCRHWSGSLYTTY